jgi:Arc/MetJ family transcription regulator
MRTNIDIDDDLLEEARRLTNIKSKKEIVHEALRVLISFSKRKPLSDIRGKVNFSPDYNYKSARSGK